MADDQDVEAMLEEPFQPAAKDSNGRSTDEKNGAYSEGSRSRKSESRHSKHRSRSAEKKKKHRKSKDRKSRSRSRHRSRSTEKRSRSKKRSRSREARRGRERDPDRDTSPSRYRDRPWRSSPPQYTRGGRFGEMAGKKLPGPERRDVMPFTPRYSPPRNFVESELSPEERDARTVFCMQLARNIRPRDLEEFFSAVAKVRDVRIITDSKTRRSKGIAYVEFWDLDSVPLALSLHGKRLLGAPIVVQPTQSEKNRMASAMLATAFGQNRGPMKLYVGSLHFNITEEMLRGIFEPFGKIESVQLLKDPESGRSRGYGFITFHNADDAKKAMEQLNGFELAGRPMKVGHVTEHQASSFQPSLDSDEMDRTGIDLGTTGRLQLMAKLAEGTGMELPQVAKQILSATPQQGSSQPPIATQCFMLSNMFDPSKESESSWDVDIRDDVIEECNKHQGVVHVFVDKASPDGNVYVKCPSVSAAVAAVNSLHGRYFAGLCFFGR
ncbi:hypothetical protein D918_09853 [Trichuris suis]|nr:hypothetical protein D918_09853 [Trichuris suis]